jgi:hypothetical protein
MYENLVQKCDCKRSLDLDVKRKIKLKSNLKELSSIVWSEWQEPVLNLGAHDNER